MIWLTTNKTEIREILKEDINNYSDKEEKYDFADRIHKELKRIESFVNKQIRFKTDEDSANHLESVLTDIIDNFEFLRNLHDEESIPESTWDEYDFSEECFEDFREDYVTQMFDFFDTLVADKKTGEYDSKVHFLSL